MFGRKERYLIVGLGNPGGKYEATRHNMGFKAIDALADRWNVSVTHTKHQSLIGEANKGNCKVMLAKPQTYMNLSGDAVGKLVRYYKIPANHLLVIYDDLDLPAGTIRIRKKGGAGTHNGMRSVVGNLGFQDFPRIRIGIGNNRQQDIVDYVIGSVSKEERKLLEGAIEKASRAASLYITDGLEKAMNRYNG